MPWRYKPARTINRQSPTRTHLTNVRFVHYGRRMQDIRSLIQLWPARAVLARDASVSVGTVHQWFNRGAIPAKYHLPVLRSAQLHNIPLDAQKLAELHHIEAH